MSVPRFGRVQLRIMKVLWEKGRASAREITDALNRIDPIAHSTVQTHLRRMEGKNAIAHDIEDRTFIYFPVVKVENARKGAIHDIVDHMFSGSPEGLVSHLLEYEYIHPDKLKKIRELIDEKEK